MRPSNFVTVHYAHAYYALSIHVVRNKSSQKLSARGYVFEHQIYQCALVKGLLCTKQTF